MVAGQALACHFAAFRLIERLGSGDVLHGCGWESFQTLDLEFSVEDAERHEGLSGASAYLQADSVITHFSISSPEGEIRFNAIPKGDYHLNIEFLGYIPFRERYSLMTGREIPGTIALQLDTLLLDAAAVSALLYPVYQVGDTLVYNAAAFNPGNNAVLEELLQKMPGVEVSDDRVMVNGVPVQSITLGGKTFFFDDLSLALKNLPARIVERIRVFDRVSSSGGGTEAALGRKNERVMDVELKDAFKKGAFGNVVLGAGAADSKSASASVSQGKGLADGRWVGSLYNDTEQLTMFASGNNMSPVKGGTGKLALNLNSSRIREMDNTISLVATYAKVREDQWSTRKYPLAENLYSDDAVLGYRRSRGADVKLELKKQGRMYLNIKPFLQIDHQRYDRERSQKYYTSGGASASSMTESGFDTVWGGGLSLDGHVENRAKTGRNFHFNTEVSGMGTKGRREELGARLLDYALEKRGWKGLLSAVYTEPLSDRWTLNLSGDARYAFSANGRTAFDAGTQMVAEAFSSQWDMSDFDASEALFFTWRPERYTLSVGGHFRQQRKKERWGESYADASKWLLTLSPYLSIESEDMDKQLYVWSQNVPIEEAASHPSMMRMGPADIMIGNPFLKPSVSIYSTANYYKTRQIQFMLELRYDRNPVVYANGLSDEGIRYSFPVNAEHPGISLTPFVNYFLYFTKKKNCYLYLNARGTIRFTDGYQAADPLDITETGFSHEEFIGRYWGDALGSVFYGNESVFSSSRNLVAELTGQMEFICRNERLTASLHFTPTYYASAFSLVPEAGEKVWKFSTGPSIELRFPKEFSLSFGVDYVRYRGYGKGFDRSLWDASLELNKDIGAFSLTFKCLDLFNQTVSLQHLVSSEFVQRSMFCNLGRTALFSVGYLFGKGSSEKQRASSRFVREMTR